MMIPAKAVMITMMRMTVTQMMMTMMINGVTNKRLSSPDLPPPLQGYPPHAIQKDLPQQCPHDYRIPPRHPLDPLPPSLLSLLCNQILYMDLQDFTTTTIVPTNQAHRNARYVPCQLRPHLQDDLQTLNPNQVQIPIL